MEGFFWIFAVLCVLASAKNIPTNTAEDSEEVFENITENVTENITENDTENDTENVAENVTENDTENASENVTEEEITEEATEVTPEVITPDSMGRLPPMEDHEKEKERLKGEVCHLPLAEGNCIGWAERYWYNAKTDRCEFFIYTGCKGNRNQFDNKEGCEMLCMF